MTNPNVYLINALAEFVYKYRHDPFSQRKRRGNVRSFSTIWN